LDLAPCPLALPFYVIGYNHLKMGKVLPQLRGITPLLRQITGRNFEGLGPKKKPRQKRGCTNQIPLTIKPYPMKNQI